MSQDLVILEPQVIAACDKASVQIAEDPAIVSGLSAAEAVRGMVVATPDAAVMATSLGKQIADAQRILEQRKRFVLRVPTLMRDAVGRKLDPIAHALKTGKEQAGRAIAAFQNEARRQAEIERRNREAEATTAQAEQRSILGDDDAPALQVTVEAPPRIVNAGDSKSFARRDPKAEVSIFTDCDPTWFEFKATRAWDSFRAAVARGDVAEPVDGNVVEWCGVRFWRETGVSFR